MIAASTDLALDARCSLGEGPVWWNDSLWFVDIEGRSLNRFRPRDGLHESWHVTARVGFAVPARNGDWIVAQDAALARLRPGKGEPERIVQIEDASLGTRLNDAKCDPTGRLYLGTMHLSATPGAGALYRLDIDSGATGRCYVATHVLDDVTISNGLAWHEPTRTMYYTDTATGGIDAFDWCPETGEVQGRRRVADIKGGVPDGMCIDREGMLWVAIWGGSRVARVDPASGREIASVPLPCSNATSCCFGGTDSGRLWITTARVGLSEGQLADQPLAGGVFVADVGIGGVAAVAMR
ncbi:MAG: SMP-30/gluconolactonase/LRE family protein [Planctomycetota bacterium]